MVKTVSDEDDRESKRVAHGPRHLTPLAIVRIGLEPTEIHRIKISFDPVMQFALPALFAPALRVTGVAFCEISAVSSGRVGRWRVFLESHGSCESVEPFRVSSSEAASTTFSKCNGHIPTRKNRCATSGLGCAATASRVRWGFSQLGFDAWRPNDGSIALVRPSGIPEHPPPSESSASAPRDPLARSRSLSRERELSSSCVSVDSKPQRYEEFQSTPETNTRRARGGRGEKPRTLRETAPL